jgi:inorganic triphosphatase YgiF
MRRIVMTARVQEIQARAQAAGAAWAVQALVSSRPGGAAAAAEPGREPRLRFVADGLAFATLPTHPLLGGPAKLRWGHRRAVYYDTESADLQHAGLTLGVRRARGGHVMILSREGSDRIEITTEEAEPRLDLFPPPARDLIDHATAQRSLKVRFSSRLRRATRLVAYEDAEIAIAFDEGEYVAGSEKTPVREIELALKSGPPASLYRFGLALLDAAPLRLSAGFAPPFANPESVRASAPEFDDDATLDSAIAALLKQSLAHFLANGPACHSADHVEAVHQIRVALRRMRSLLKLLGRSFPSPEIAYLGAEAKRLADAFGDARDWTVFADLVEAGPARNLPDVPGLAALVAQARERAEAGLAQGIGALAAASATRFVLTLQLYVAMNGWRNAAPEAELRALLAPVTGFAARALEQSYRRLKKRARGFDDMSAEHRHSVRIALKQMRYAVDFFGHLFGSGAAKAYVAQAAGLQDMLGEANDAAVAARLVSRLDVAGDPALGFAAGAVVGWCGRGGLVDEPALRAAWKKLRKADRFWRAELA